MTATANHELSITRLIDAPPEVVYRVWTERTGEWWAPRPYTTPVVELDLKPGGRGLMVMEGPDGTEMPNEGVFLEIVPDKKIVFTNAFTAGGGTAGPVLGVVLSLLPEGGGGRFNPASPARRPGES